MRTTPELSRPDEVALMITAFDGLVSRDISLTVPPGREANSPGLLTTCDFAVSGRVHEVRLVDEIDTSGCLETGVTLNGNLHSIHI